MSKLGSEADVCEWGMITYIDLSDGNVNHATHNN